MLAQIVVALAENYLVEELERRETEYTGTLNKSQHQLPSVVRAKYSN